MEVMSSKRRLTIQARRGQATGECGVPHAAHARGGLARLEPGWATAHCSSPAWSELRVRFHLDQLGLLAALLQEGISLSFYSS